MVQSKTYIALDVGEKRIGVARGDSSIRIAVDGTELAQITHLVEREHAAAVIVGYPRNQSGMATAQTAYVERFAEQLVSLVPEIIFQDESLTSVLAEQQLRAHGKSYTRGDIDALAAAIILQDYLENRL
jgi:putative transcription antitermination factor YqgF